MSRIKKWIEALSDLFFVKKCVACGELLEYDCGESLCSKCAADWDNAKRTVCPRCLQAESKCRCGFGSRYITSVRHLALYDHTDRELVINKLIYALKKSNNGEVFEFVAGEMAEILVNKKDLRNTVVTNVPRSPVSVRKYGYDHAEKLAVRIAERLGLEYVKALGHSGGKKEQKSLNMLQRQFNAKKNCFFREGNAEKIRGKTVLLVDDIGTTGAMTDACAALLKRNGAAEVHCILAAKNKLKDK